MPIVYAMIAEMGSVTVQCSTVNTDFSNVVNLLLSRVQDQPNMRKSYAHEGHSFNYLVSQNHVMFLCVTNVEFPTRVAFAFLQKIMNDYRPGYTTPGVLQKDMDFFSNDPRSDRITNIRTEIDNVREIMVENIGAVLERGEKLEDILQQTDLMTAHSGQFNTRARKLKTAMWWKNVKLWIVIGVVAFVLLLVLIWAICGITFQRCR
eukprot:TRINITY_DN2902_c0_g1_i1.p2 TRINITY_DN2902_c0_g1~~TRINITY_DN2902_c0_g1_i1.p2  ORF type:complete len:206 (-),score=64.37 TRINITY_DN2902_c0_g1_i1:67-684(-)